MKTFSPIDDVLRGADLPPEARRRIQEVVARLVERERQRCVQLCRERAEKWRTTSLAGSAIAQAREEARARANEASYLADLLESGETLAPPVN